MVFVRSATLPDKTTTSCDEAEKEPREGSVYGPDPAFLCAGRRVCDAVSVANVVATMTNIVGVPVRIEGVFDPLIARLLCGA